MTDILNYAMFEAVATKALRAGLRDEGRKMSDEDLRDEATSLAYTFAAIAVDRVRDVIAERGLGPKG